LPKLRFHACIHLLSDEFIESALLTPILNYYSKEEVTGYMTRLKTFLFTSHVKNSSSVLNALELLSQDQRISELLDTMSNLGLKLDESRKAQIAEIFKKLVVILIVSGCPTMFNLSH